MKRIQRIYDGQVVTPEGIQEGNVFLEGDKIKEINAVGPEGRPSEGMYDASGCYVLPGFIDIHTHGGSGVDANEGEAEDFHKLSAFSASRGTTAYLPTVMTDTYDRTVEAMKRIAQARDEGIHGSEILGIHLEGPYLELTYKGAMPADQIRKPSIDELKAFQEAACGGIRLMTIAPEAEGAPGFIRKAREMGIFLSAGHTGATYEEVMACIDAGLSHATHTFNAMKMMHHRFPAVVGAVLDSSITAEIIPDGAHVHPAIVRVLLRAKGCDKVVGITDSLMAAGLPDGWYTLGGNDVEVVNGDAWLGGGQNVRAGSTLVMDQAFRNLMAFTGASIEEVSGMLSANPAKAVGVEGKKGRLAPGFDADIVILDKDCCVKATIVGGRLVYERETGK